MNQVWEFFRKLLDTSDFPPRWHCGNWSEFHGWLYIFSDLMIWSAYFTIPLMIVRFISKRKDARFVKLYFLFAAFILACGSTHFLDAITFWFPVYRLNAVVRFMTGIISWVTVFYIVKLLPAAFSLKPQEQFEAEMKQREKAEELLKINNAMLNEAQDIAKIGHWQWDVKSNKIEWSKTMGEIYGFNGQEHMTFEAFIDCMHPEDKPFVEETFRIAFEQKQFQEFYHRIIMPNGKIRTLHSKGEIVKDAANNVVKMIGTGQDVTDQKRVEQELMLKSQELQTTNIELQKFASVASHDLKEPLRKIVTFASMLEKEYKDVLGERGKIYIEKMTSASSRMQRLIDDILDFSGISDSGMVFTKVSLDQVIKQVISDIEVQVEKTKAKIIVEKLPEIEANAGQLNRLFQNLISNAIKFRKAGVDPSIYIHADIIRGSDMPPDYVGYSGYNFSVFNNPRYWEQERFCKIYIQDNGIGFDESYVDRIFQIFQRLHGKSDYEGTGIGLAVCKKVADIHHGIITAKSKQGEGSTFIIILPILQRNFSRYERVNH